MIFLLNKKKDKDFKSTDDMMVYLANEAVDIAQNNYKIELNYAPASIEKVEIILGKLHEEVKKDKSQKGIDGLAMAFGAYMGEVIRRQYPNSKWNRNHSVAGKDSFPLHWLNGESFPCAWAYKRITNGPEDNVWYKYKVIKKKAEQTSTEAIE